MWFYKLMHNAVRKDIEIPMSRDEQANLHDTAVNNLKRDRRFRVFSFLFVIPIFFIYSIICYFIVPVILRFTQYTTLAGLVLGTIVGVPMVLSAYAIQRPMYRYHLRRLCRERSYEICMKCGYYLRGLDDEMTKCPECGAKREVMPEREAE